MGGNRTYLFTKSFITAALLASGGFLSGCADQPHGSLSSTHTLNSTSPDALYRIAEKLREVGDYERALHFYQDVLNNDPSYIPGLIGLGKSYSAMHQFEYAQKAFERALEAESDNLLAKREIGFLYLHQNKPDLCIKMLLEIHEKDPQNTSILNGLGICHDLKGDPKAAQKWYKEALQIAPDHVGILSNLGLSHALSGDEAIGLKLLKEAADKPHASPRERQNLALAYGLAGQFDKAEELYRRDLDEEAVQKNLDYINTINNSRGLESKDIFATLASGKAPSKVAQKPLAPVKETGKSKEQSHAKHKKKIKPTNTVMASPAVTSDASHDMRKSVESQGSTDTSNIPLAANPQANAISVRSLETVKEATLTPNNSAPLEENKQPIDSEKSAALNVDPTTSSSQAATKEDIVKRPEEIIADEKDNATVTPVADENARSSDEIIPVVETAKKASHATASKSKARTVKSKVKTHAKKLHVNKSGVKRTHKGIKKHSTKKYTRGKKLTKKTLSSRKKASKKARNRN